MTFEQMIHPFCQRAEMFGSPPSFQYSLKNITTKIIEKTLYSVFIYFPPIGEPHVFTAAYFDR